MHGRLLVVTVVGAAVALPAAVANAKGPMPSSATIRGPGISHTLRIKPGKAGHSALEKLTRQTGFFLAVAPQDARPMLPGRPQGKLGPRYTIRYLFPRRPPAHVKRFRVTQYVYPYAAGGAVTYMMPGQLVLRSRGGWFLGGLALKQTLVQYGLPAVPSSNSPSSSNLSFLETLLVSAPIVLLLIGAPALLGRKRRGRADPSVFDRARPSAR